MQHEQAAGAPAHGLTHYLTPFNMWALAVGGAIGWGAFVMPATTLLPKAGPVGTIVGMVLAALIMVVVAANITFMLKRNPDSGGTFTFVRRTMGYDHAFLAAWALILAYLAIMWANSTSFILISRFLLGPVFQFGFHYVVAGYDVYFGEILVTLAILCLFGYMAMAPKRIVKTINTAFAVCLVVGSAACLVIVVASGAAPAGAFEPAFPPGTPPAAGVFAIVALAPWAFLGFESVSHGAGECSFPVGKLFAVMVAGVACGAFIYIAMTVVSVWGMPAGYASWPAYLADLGNLSGIDGLPTFSALYGAAGPAGMALLAVTILCALATTLFTLYRSSSRLIHAVAEEGILPPWFAQVNADGVPRNAILAIMAASVVVPFVGRAAIGWIVDVTSVSAAIVYGYASLCSFRGARAEGNIAITATGVIGMIAAVVFLVYPLVPNFWSVSALAPESYLILAAWAIIGLILFRIVFQRDEHNRFGKSTIVWIMLIFLILFASTMWMRQVSHDAMQNAFDQVSSYYTQDYANRGIELSEKEVVIERNHVAQQTAGITQALLNNSLVQMALILFSLAIMFNIYSLMRKRERELDFKRAAAEQTSKAKSTFLSNMSHDIRTPMNAILGYTHLARRPGTTAEEAQAYLGKIDASGKHLLALINNVLDMSRIESGKMELDPAPCDLLLTMGAVRDMFATQMSEKKIDFAVSCDDVRQSYVLCDENRLNRVLLNLLSNAYKFTPEGGSVTVRLEQAGEAPEGCAAYVLRVKDSGIGMTPEFAAKVFEAFERERTSTVSGIQGTGLGMAITKSIVDLMDGEIVVDTAPGEGTQFTIHVAFELVGDGKSPQAGQPGAEGATELDFTGKRILLVEDNEINREIATLILEDAGFVLEEAENGKIAVDKVAAAEPGWYDIVLMDVQMPVMNGYDATRAIRALDDPQRAGVPIVAASANAFAEDVQKARDAGMDGHVAKPLDVPKVMEALAAILSR